MYAWEDDINIVDTEPTNEPSTESADFGFATQLWEYANSGEDAKAIFYDDDVNLITSELSGTDGEGAVHSWEGDPDTEATDNFGTNCYISEPIIYESITADGSLGAEVETTHGRPPADATMVIGPDFSGICYALVGKNLYYSLPKQPEYWPATYFIEVATEQDPLVTAVFHNGNLHVLSKARMYYIQGSAHQTLFPITLDAKTGAQGHNGAVSVGGQGIHHVGPDGIYLFQGGVDTKITGDAFQKLFVGEASQGMPAAVNLDKAWFLQFNDMLFFGYPSGSETYPSNFIVIWLINNKVSYYNYNDGSEVVLSAAVHDLTNQRMLVGDTDGFIRQLEDKTKTQDVYENIAIELQSMDFTLQTRKHFPRWAKYDIEVNPGATLSGKAILDDLELTEHSLTVSRDTRRRLINSDNGNRMAMRVTGTGVVKVYAIEME